jgi:hypothetical protein
LQPPIPPIRRGGVGPISTKFRRVRKALALENLGMSSRSKPLIKAKGLMQTVQSAWIFTPERCAP